MRYRVTSITDPEVGTGVAAVTTKLEDWLNAALSEGDFGPGLDQFTVFVVSTFDDVAQNERWASARDKLGRLKHPVSGQTLRYLSVGLSIPPARLLPADLKKGLSITCRTLREKLNARPRRIPKGFQYERFAAAVSAALGTFITV